MNKNYDYLKNIFILNKCEFDESISIEKIIYNAKINDTFEKLIKLCFKYEINFLEKLNNKYCIRRISEMLIDYQTRKKTAYQHVILKMSELMVSNNDWLDSKMQIDKLTNDLKNSLKELELLYELLTHIYDDDKLFLMCKSSTFNNKKNMNIIEEYSN